MKNFTLLLIPCLLLISLPQGRITLYLAGDSTMAEKLPEKRPESGWGEYLQQFFDEKDVIVENHARNGRSTRTFLSEGLWETIVGKLKKGDYVFIQFGHNDESREKVDRYTPPKNFRDNLIRFVRDVKQKKAFPVLLTPVVRRRFDGQRLFYDTHGEYPDIVRSLAADEDVPMIDMHRKTEELLKQYGAKESEKLFLHLKPGENPNYPNGIEDNTHFSPFGAELVARLAAGEIRKLGFELASHLRTP